jgi:hypothetical protein
LFSIFLIIFIPCTKYWKRARAEHITLDNWHSLPPNVLDSIYYF